MVVQFSLKSATTNYMNNVTVTSVHIILSLSGALQAPVDRMRPAI